jgi:2-polyprenyl-3-methyl-5-hydroxy-6-metoxy-1,4-benzoquinol methylase
MWEEKDAFHKKGQDENWWWEKARREIVQQCMKKVITRDVNILEIGAGYGSMTGMLSNFGTVNAIEPYADAVSYLQAKLKVKTYLGTFESFNETQRYDLITCFDVLEHIEDDKKALSKMAALVNDKGFLVLTVPAYKFLWNRHDEINHHYRRYSKKELLKKIPRDLSIKKISYFNTLLFPMAILDKLVLSKNKRSYSFNPNSVVNRILYRIFSAEKTILRFLNLPFGVSILLIAEKRNSSS